MQKSNSKIRCLIIDDEELAREGIAHYVSQVPFLELVATCESAIEGQQVLDSTNVDLCFCDINMPYLSGIDWVRSLNNPPLIIFTTAYSEFAIQSYEVNTLDYLLKPISFDRFFKSCQKAKVVLKKQDLENDDDFIFVKVDLQIKKIWCKDILYIESQNNYINIVTKVGSFLTLLTLKELQENLPQYFLKVQKSFIINIHYVEAIEGNNVVINDTLISISRSLKNEVFEQLTQGKFILKNNK